MSSTPSLSISADPIIRDLHMQQRKAGPSQDRLASVRRRIEAEKASRPGIAATVDDEPGPTPPSSPPAATPGKRRNRHSHRLKRRAKELQEKREHNDRVPYHEMPPIHGWRIHARHDQEFQQRRRAASHSQPGEKLVINVVQRRSSCPTSPVPEEISESWRRRDGPQRLTDLIDEAVPCNKLRRKDARIFHGDDDDFMRTRAWENGVEDKSSPLPTTESTPTICYDTPSPLVPQPRRTSRSDRRTSAGLTPFDSVRLATRMKLARSSSAWSGLPTSSSPLATGSRRTSRSDWPSSTGRTAFDSAHVARKTFAEHLSAYSDSRRSSSLGYHHSLPSMASSVRKNSSDLGRDDELVFPWTGSKLLSSPSPSPQRHNEFKWPALPGLLPPRGDGDELERGRSRRRSTSWYSEASDSSEATSLANCMDSINALDAEDCSSLVDFSDLSLSRLP